MPKTKISEFSATPANNTDIDSINIAEGCAPSGINDAIRELMAQLKDFQTGAVGDSFNGPIGTSTAAAGAFTTLSATGAITSTLATGTAPLVIASTTKVANLNVDSLDGADWAAPAALGSTTPAAVSATTLTTSSTVTHNGGTANGVTYLNGSKVLTSGSALSFDGTNLGIGTNSPSAKLDITSASAGFSNIKLVQTGVRTWAIENTGTSGLFKIIEAGVSDRLVIDGSGNVGIGTSSPSYSLSVAKDGNSSIVLAQLRNSNAGSSAATSFAFGNDTTAEAARIVYGSSTNSGIPNTLLITNDLAGPILLRTDGTERGRIAATGGIQSVTTISVGNATPSASGAGITFPATQSASSDANTLDDYEEGDWTASFVPNTSGSITMAFSTGTYTKVGRAVTIAGLFKVSSVSSPTGYLKINGLPFSGGSNTKFRCAISINGDAMNVTMTTTLVASVQAGSEIYVFKTDGVGGLALTTAADMKANTEIFVNGTYFID